MAYRTQQTLQNWGNYYHLYQDWSHIGFGIWREGTAILSRHPLHHSYSAYVSSNQCKDNEQSRNVTLSCVDVPYFGLVHIANVHMNQGHHGFHDEFETLKWLIETRRPFGFRGELICGEFNAPAGEKEYQHMVGDAQYVDQFYIMHPHRFFEPTYRGKIHGWERSDPKRIDYILQRSGYPLQVKSFEPIFNDQLFPMVSDHFGLLARFDLL